MTRSLPRQPGDAQSGVATVEFALWASLIFATMLPCLDFALYLIADSRLSAAVGQATILGYDQRNGTVNTTQLAQYVSAQSGLPSSAVTVTIACNGGAQSCTTAPASRVCACASTTIPVTYTTAASCGSTCASGATSGFYLTVNASYTFTSIVPDGWLNGSAITSATTTRLQ
jgi:Flp pilus assembly protein TadG